MPHSPYASPTTQTNAGLLPRNTPSKSQAESQAAWLTSSASLSTISRTFNSLSKVLFIFPSRYLFAIGLSPIFSFRWSLPPILSSNPKLLDSWSVYRKAWYVHGKYGIFTLYDVPFQGTCPWRHAENTSRNYNADTGGASFQI